MNKKNKKLYPAWHPVLDTERYPHTHYNKELNLNWIYQTIGILKSWCMTLTHFIAKLAKLHNDDIEKLIEEMQTLLDKINSWINALTSALDNYATAEIYFQTQVINQAESLTLLTETIYNAIDKISPLLIEVLECIETTLNEHTKELEEHSKEIDNIQTELKDVNDKLKDIDNIEKRLDAIESYIDEIFELLAALISNTMSSTVLTYGSDYTITFYNGFEPNAENGGTSATVPHITETITELKAPDKTYYTATIKLLCSTLYPMTNNNIITPGVEGAPLFCHGDGYELVPESRILQITFLNDLSNKTMNNYLQSGNEIWNMLPNRARASWSVLVNAANVSAGNVMLYAPSISDGYNTQYYSRYDEELSFADLNLTMELNYNYNS